MVLIFLPSLSSRRRSRFLSIVATLRRSDELPLYKPPL